MERRHLLREIENGGAALLVAGSGMRGLFR